MRVLGVEYSFGKDGMSVSMCRLSNENSKGGIDLENISTFKLDKDYDLASLVVSQVNNLNVKYVVVDSTGIGIRLYDELYKVLGDRVVRYKTNKINEHELLVRLTQCPLLEKLGLKLNYKMSHGGYTSFDYSKYKNLEYLQTKSLALANYYMFEKLFMENESFAVNEELKTISNVYIKDGTIIKNKFGSTGIKIGHIDVINMINKESIMVTIQEKDKIKSYLNGKEMMVFG